MAKKYLNMEEAAAVAGVSIEDLKDLRESGKIRGFADRGTWKFKSEDIEEFVRSRQADSDPEVPLFDEEVDAEGSSLVLGDEGSGIGSSVISSEDSAIMRTSEDVLGEQATVIRGGALDDDEPRPGSASDSDVRLILDDNLAARDSEPDADILGGDSDSDVRLVEDSGPTLVDTGADSDSDVQLIATEDASDSDVQLVAGPGVESDSDVQLVGTPEADSDSDVELVGAADKTDRDVKLDDSIMQRSDSDVRLVDSGILRSDSDVRLMPSGSGVELSADEDATVLRADSGVGVGDESGVELVGGSGPDLENVGDSGIALEGLDDSGISLSDDSITLASDSGIALGEPVDSGLSLDDSSDDELNATVPMLKTGGLDDELGGTDLEVPALDDSEFELEGEESGETDTSVILFDDDDAEFDDRAATVAKKKGAAAADDFEGETLDFDATDEGFDEELEVSEDIVGEDDELDELDVFDAGDEDFEGDFQTGESHAEFVSPVGPGGRMAVPVEQEWGVGTFIGLVVATLFLMICGTMVYDLVRYMWQPAGEDQVGPFLSMFKDLI